MEKVLNIVGCIIIFLGIFLLGLLFGMIIKNIVMIEGQTEEMVHRMSEMQNQLEVLIDK